MLTDTERAGLQASQGAYLPDTCRISRQIQALDSYGESPADADDFVEGPEIACGFAFGEGEVTGIDGLPVSVDGTLRLPVDTRLEESDRIRVVRRAGVELSPSLAFSIVPPVRLGPTAMVLKLKRVTR